MPIKDTTRVAPEGALMLKLPLASVWVAVLVPLMATVALDSASPVDRWVTLPETFMVWAKAGDKKSWEINKQQNSKAVLLFIRKPLFDERKDEIKMYRIKTAKVRFGCLLKLICHHIITPSNPLTG
jgi:hypothetical protein